MAKLQTGAMARGAVPHFNETEKAPALFNAFTQDTIEMVVSGFTVADGIEGELIAKIAFGLITQRMAAANPALKALVIEPKRLKVAAIAALSMGGARVFKNFAETCEGMEHADAMEWVAAKFAGGYRFLNRIEGRWRMGAAVSGQAYKIRGVVVQCLQAKNQNAGLMAFVDATRAIVADTMAQVAAEKKAKPPSAILDVVTKYLTNKAAELKSDDIAALIATLNKMHGEAVQMETISATVYDDDDGEEEQMAA